MSNYSKYCDDELVKFVRESKKSVKDMAFCALYDRYSAKVNAFCLYKLGRSSIATEEVFQQTWVRFYNSLIAGKEVQTVLPFLISIAGNLAIDHYRSQQLRRKHIKEDVESEVLEEIALPGSLQGVEQNELGEMIQTAINCLEGIYKDAFVMKRIEGLSLEEIAEIAGISISAAKQRVSRATNMVRTILAPYVKDYIEV
ncbi:MAG: RNA polymerase sigma factor [Candidatus Kapabacteria bacterium]|nr:RNA polymerase sigma factor [Candidatus Kapabacteria bacterium]